jgi:polyisoprenyl-phosphate glycosyltransferase
LARISVVVPVYWNAESLPLLKAELDKIAAQLPEDEFEFVFTDDGSGDNSFAVLTDLAAVDKRVRLVRLSRNFGSNAALLAGFTHATGDCVVAISADLQDPPAMIPELISQWKAGYEVVLAARRERDDPIPSRWFSGGFNYLYRKLVFPDFPPNGFDFMLIDRQVVDILVDLREKNSYIFGQVMWVGFNRTLVFYDRQKRQHGKSRWTFTKKIKYFIDAFSAFSYLPLRVSTILGFVLGGLGLLYAAILIVLRITSQVPVEGWTSLIVVVLVASGTQLVLVGVLGEYLWRTLDETRRRPPFIVRTTVNIEQKKD